MNKLERWLKEADAKVRSFERAEGLTDDGWYERIGWIGEYTPRRELAKGCYQIVRLRGED